MFRGLTFKSADFEASRTSDLSRGTERNDPPVMTALRTSLFTYTVVEVVAALPSLEVTVRSILYWLCAFRE